MIKFLRRNQPAADFRTIAIAGFGTFVALLLLGAATSFGYFPMIIAPFGASCGLLFAASASPVSQPINVIGGHVVSAAIGTACVLIWPGSFVVAALATGLAVVAMLALRIFHPPSGATALLAYATAASWMFVLMPVLLGSVILVVLAYIYHAFTNTPYPNSAPR